MRRGFLVGAGLLCLTQVTVSPSRALFAGGINGYADVTTIQFDVDGEDRGTLRQEYTANWSRSLTPYVTVRSSVRYYRFARDQDQALSTWRQEFQPTAELVWKHPYFLFSSSAQRRRSEASVSRNDRTTDNLLFAFSTGGVRYPYLSLHYDWQHIFDTDAIHDRDTRDRRLQANVDYSRPNETIAYSLAHRFTENVITGLQSTETSHFVRLGAIRSAFSDRRLRLSGNYTYSRSARTDESLSSDTILEIIPVAAGLFAEDASPEFGTLDEVLGLTDGNTGGRTQPGIDIGGGLVDRNLGADLGFTRFVSALYMYTEEASGTQPGWSVYASDDNLAWQLWTGNPGAQFNAGLNRYEITFDAIETRYVKVVNRGVNEVAEAYVTELQALHELRMTEDETLVQNAHLADFKASYHASPRLSGTLSLSYQHQPAQRTVGSRNNFDYVLGARYRQTEMISHHMRWEQAFQRFGVGTEDLRQNSAVYTLLLEPLQPLNATLSLDSRHGFEDGVKTQETNSALAQVGGAPIRGLNVSLDASRSRRHQYDRDTRHDARTFGASVDASVSRALDAILSYSYQLTRSRPERVSRTRNRYGMGFSYRLTRNIFARGTINIVDDVKDNMSQNYLLSWNMLPKLKLSARAILQESGDYGHQSKSYGVNATYDTSARSSLYLRYHVNDLSEIGGTRTASFQQGFRTAF